MIKPEDLNQNLLKLNALESRIEQIKDGVCFVRCYCLARKKKKIPLSFRLYMGLVNILIKISHRICRIKLPGYTDRENKQ